MKRILFCPDADSSGAPLAPKSPKRTRARVATQPVAVKETEAEQIIHELFRLANVDLRANPHAKSLAERLVKLIT